MDASADAPSGPRWPRARRWIRRGMTLGGTALLALTAGGLYLAFAPAGDGAPHPFNQDRNAVWLEHRWLEKPHSEEEIETLVRGLWERGIVYVFPHLIPFNGAGRLPPHDREEMRRFLAVSRRATPGLRVLPWVGGLRAGWRRQRTGMIDLADLGQRQRMVAECRGLVDEGFDGIHLNVEPVNDGNVDFLALLRALRTAIGEEHMLSISAIRPAPMAVPFAPNLAWSLDYYDRVAAIADQVVVMGYDTAIPTPALYRRYVAWAAGATTLRAEGQRARVLLGIPTYDPRGIVHRSEVETPENALLGIVAGLRGQGGGGTFEGVALYAEWTTDKVEWDLYGRLWRGAAPGPRTR